MIRLRRLQPDTVRGIRHWAIELAVVVVGVLLALWAAEWAQDRRQARDDERIMDEVRKEVRYNLSAIALFSAQEACWNERLAELRDLLANSGEDWPGTAMQPVEGEEDYLFANVIRGSHKPILREQFDRALDAGTIERLPEAATMRAGYRLFDMFDQSQWDVSEGMGDLRQIAAPGRLGEDARFALMGALVTMDDRLNKMRYLTGLYAAIPESYREFTDFEKKAFEREMAEVREQLGACAIDIDVVTGRASE